MSCTLTSCPVGWVFDEAACQRAWDDGRNFWSLYIEELLRRLGLTPQRVPRRELAANLAGHRSLVLPAGLADSLNPDELAALEGWVRAGGLLISFAAPGSEGLGGVALQGAAEQPDGDFSASATMTFTPPAQALLDLDHETPASVFSPVRYVTAEADLTILAELHARDGSALGPAISFRRLGEGWVCYWAFDLAQTAWVVQQGRPVYEDHVGDGYLRATDGII
ncbi:MAG: hypothetical protein J7M26_02095, partial [Armatimonadetes bacterium]|nr:hypothetical protein [Armatimonadota bacterium]